MSRAREEGVGANLHIIKIHEILFNLWLRRRNGVDCNISKLRVSLVLCELRLCRK
jgi:hypothetical protein